MSSLPPENAAFPRPASPPFPGLGLLLRTAQNRLFLLLAGGVGEEALTDIDDLLSDPVVLATSHQQLGARITWKAMGQAQRAIIYVRL